MQGADILVESLLKEVVDTIFGNPGVEGALGNEPLGTPRNHVLFLFDMIEPTPFSNGLLTPGQPLGDKVVVGLTYRKEWGKLIPFGFRRLRRTRFGLILLLVHKYLQSITAS